MNTNKQSHTNNSNRSDANRSANSRKIDSDSKKVSQEQKALDTSKQSQKDHLSKDKGGLQNATQKSDKRE